MACLGLDFILQSTLLLLYIRLTGLFYKSLCFFERL